MAGTLESRFAERVQEFQRRRTEERPEGGVGGEMKDDEIQYLLDSVPFILEYSSSRAVEHDESGALAGFVAVTHKSSKNNVLQRYLMHVEKQVDQTTMAAVTLHEDSAGKRPPREAEYYCKGCDSGMDYHQRESMLVCPRCGTCKTFTEMNASNLTYEQEIHQDVVTYFAYKRLNHFCEWLNSLQAKVRLGVVRIPSFFCV